LGGVEVDGLLPRGLFLGGRLLSHSGSAPLLRSRFRHRKQVAWIVVVVYVVVVVCVVVVVGGVVVFVVVAVAVVVVVVVL
jgi:hypothetical protein